MAIEWADNFQPYGLDTGSATTASLLLFNGAYEGGMAGGANASLRDDPDPNITAPVLRLSFNISIVTGKHFIS